MEINGQVGNSTPDVLKTPEPMATKFGVGDDVGNSALCKISLRSDKGVLLPTRPVTTRAGGYKVTRLGFLAG